MFQSSRRALYGVGLTALASAYAGAVSAQSNPPTPPAAQPSPPPPAIAEIVVTAQKREQSINKVPLSVTAVSGDALVQRGINSASDLTRVVSGFDFTPTSFGEPVYVLRGVGLYDSGLASAPAVTVYLDQVPLPYPEMTEVQPLDLERVEVLKGPQGTLFGENSTGGAVNYIAAKPTNAFHAGVDATYERFDELDTTAFVSGPITDTLNGRFAFRTVQGGAWQESTSRPGDVLGNQDIYQGRILLDWRPIEKLKFELNINGFYDGSDTQAQQLTAVVPTKPALASTALLEAPLAAQNDRSADWPSGYALRSNDPFYQFALRSDYQVTPRVVLTSLSSYDHISVDKLTDISAVNQTTGELNLLETLGHVRSFSQELRLAGAQGPANWTVGADYDYSGIYDSELATVNDTADQPIPALPAFHYPEGVTQQTVNDYAVFGNLDYKILQKMTAHLGLRGTDSVRRASSCVFDQPQDDNAVGNIYTVLQELFVREGLKTTPVVPVGAGQCSSLTPAPDLSPSGVHNGLNEKNLSWRVGLDYNFDQGTLLYASYNRGYKAGVISPILASSTSEFTPAKQERVDAYEVGIKAPLLDRRVQVNGAMFYYAYDDKQLRTQLADPEFGLLQQLINIPRSQIWGFDGSLQAQPFRGLNVSLSGVYLESDVTKSFSAYNGEGAYGNFSGSQLPYTPKVEVVGDIQYEHRLTDALNGFVGGSVTSHSSANATFNTPSAPANDFYLRGYTLLDLRVGVDAPDRRWRLNIFGRNVTNTYYWSTVYQATDTRFRSAGLPAVFGATVSYRWQ